VFFLDKCPGIEVGDLAGDADGKTGGVEVADCPDAAAPLEESVPHGRHVLPQGVERADATDHRATGGRSHFGHLSYQHSAHSRPPGAAVSPPGTADRSRLTADCWRGPARGDASARR